MGWFSRGPKPDPLADRAAADDVVFHAAGVRVRASATDLRFPGHNKVSTAVRLHRGSVVVQPNHLAITYRKYLAVDGALREDPAAPAQVSFEADGVYLSIDLTRALARVGAGELSNYR